VSFTWSDDMTAIIAVARTAVDAIPDDGVGAEIGFRAPDRLVAGEFPHLFVFNPRDAATALDFGQADVVTTYQAEFYVRDTRDVAATYCQALKDTVAADPTLGGTARRFRISAIVLIEDRPEGADLVILLEFQVARTLP
jgi:hypothetical protein